jgi:hypothetical protein
MGAWGHLRYHYPLVVLAAVLFEAMVSHARDLDHTASPGGVTRRDARRQCWVLWLPVDAAPRRVVLKHALKVSLLQAPRPPRLLQKRNPAASKQDKITSAPCPVKHRVCQAHTAPQARLHMRTLACSLARASLHVHTYAPSAGPCMCCPAGARRQAHDAAAPCVKTCKRDTHIATCVRKRDTTALTVRDMHAPQQPITAACLSGPTAQA